MDYQLDLFGGETPIEEVGAHKRKRNPTMQQLHGAAENGRTCGTCGHCVAHTFGNRIRYKCELWKESQVGDIRPKTAACAKYVCRYD